MTAFLGDDAEFHGSPGTAWSVGGSLYPTYVNPGVWRYDATSVVLTNTLGAKNILAGTPAIDTATTWLNQYITSDPPGAVAVYGINVNGTYGGTFASRSSDNPFLTAHNVVGCIGYGLHDNTSVNHNVWGSYNAVGIVAGSVASGCFGTEISVFNSSSTAPAEDPYNFNPAGNSEVLRLNAAADGVIGGNDVGVAISIIPNGAKCISGILIANGALDTGINAIAPAIQLPASYAVTWYSAAATVSCKLYVDSTSGYLTTTAPIAPVVNIGAASWAADFSGSTTNIATGAHQTLTPGAGLLIVHDINDNDVAMYLCAAAVCTLVSTGGTHWVASTTTPAAGKLSVAFDAVNGSYAIYNNQGATRTIAVAGLRTKPTA